jgi:hypothetical protein
MELENIIYYFTAHRKGNYTLKKECSEELEKSRIDTTGTTPIPMQYQIQNKGMQGTFLIQSKKFGKFFVISSMIDGWDHVSVSKIRKNKKKTPLWEEMCFIKNLFFEPNEIVIQYHPKESEYINFDPNVLHLWKNHKLLFPTPPTKLV